MYIVYRNNSKEVVSITDQLIEVDPQKMTIVEYTPTEEEKEKMKKGYSISFTDKLDFIPREKEERKKELSKAKTVEDLKAIIQTLL